MIEETRKNYEFMARWDHETGQYSGAQIAFFDTVLRDGEVVSRGPSKPYGVGEGLAFPLTDIMDQLTIDALAANESLQSQLATQTESLQSQLATQTEALAQLEAITAERDALLAQVAELTAPPTGRTLTIEQYRDLFTASELVAVLQAAYAADANCQLLLLKVQTATNGIDLDSESVAQGLAYLTSIGILKDGRAAEIRA